MAKVTHVMKAMKDIPKHGIKAGEPYYWWKFRNSGKHISKTAPTRQQLTQSEFLKSIYDAEDSIANLSAESMSDISSGVDDIVSDLESLRDEQEEKRLNMPESLQDSGSGEMLQNRYYSVDEMINELQAVEIPSDEDLKEEIKEELGDTATEDEINARLKERIEEVAQEVKQIGYGG